ncbi:MAG: putative lipoprotein [Deltaproteobacteria bacterium]|nr:putative lipoprotein [Deltaproteobacteria bacterium]
MVARRLCCLAVVAVLACCAVAAAEQKIIYQKQSPYSLVVVTEDDRGMRTLSFGTGGVRQSVFKVGDLDHLELPYAPVMVSGLALCPEPRRVLVVGLGGGSIPSFLHKHYPKTRIDAVEIDPVVVEVAKQFFGFSEDETLKAYVQDGRQFIEERPNVYDIIFLDAFGSDSIPYHLATREFLEAVRRAITPQGVVLADVWGPGSNRLYASMVRTYQEVFDELYILEVQGAANQILIALPRKLGLAREELARRAGAISKQKQFRFDMADLVTYGYQYANEKDPRAQVLIDKK